MARRKEDLPGSIYSKRGRYYWEVNLPDETASRPRALKPGSSTTATSNREVAEEIAWDLWDAAKLRATAPGSFDGTVGGLVWMYREHAAKTYRHPDGSPTSQVPNIRYATQPLVDLFDRLPVEDFGPRRLREVWEIWIGQGNRRSTINNRCSILRSLFRWGVGQELVRTSILEALRAVEPLLKGRSEAKEPRKVRAVKPDVVRKTQEFMTPIVRTMVECQLFTGMRSVELTWMRPQDIERKSDGTWTYHVPPEANKCECHNDGEGDETYDRNIPIIPRLQTMLEPLMLKAGQGFIFKPAESERQRAATARTARIQKVDHPYGSEAERVKAFHKARLDADGNPYERAANQRALGEKLAEKFDSGSYRLSISRAISRANKTIMAELVATMPGTTDQRQLESATDDN